MPAIEVGQALADPRAAADALRHQREPVDRPPDIPLPQRARDVHETSMEDERLGLAKGVDHRVDEAHEESGVGLHRARRVEQQHETQRTMLAPPPDEIDRRSAMADAPMDRAPDVEPPAAAPSALAPHQSRAHAPCQPLGERVNLGRLLAIGDVADVLGPEGASARGLVARVSPRRALFGFVAACAARRSGSRSVRPERPRQGPRLSLAALAGVPRRANAPHPDAEPEGVEERVEAQPVRARRAEQRPQRGLQRDGPPAGVGAEHREGVAAFGEPDRKAAVAQQPRKGYDAHGRPAVEVEGLIGSCRHGLPHATLPRRRSVASRVMRARSSCVFKRQIRVS